ncbi:MAG: Na+:solute symporter, partial [Ignavibacteria bacterium]|nr:Na+:solute symporter [Ignavibacteria bacterium]
GIAGNWLWWNFVFGGVLTIFFFAKLWRRAGVMTDVEFIELRYSGKPAAFLRGFRALYLGLFLNCIIMGWVNVAMMSILEGIFGIAHSQSIFYIAACMVLVAAYSAMSGLWGVAATDVFQFVFAMVGTLVLAILLLQLPQVGGITGLQEKLPKYYFDFFPNVGNATSEMGTTLAISVMGFLAYIGIQWWASWYPGAEPGGGGYVAQRMMAAKDERHSVLATLWFTVAHYCLRPWPWILTGLATLVLYPQLSLADKKLGYVFAMRDFLPTGLLGLLVAAFFAAYMSTIATHLNWGTSYVVNDFYRRFVKKEAEEKEYVRISRITTILLMLVSVVVTMFIQTISGAWSFIIEAGAGLGLVLILRWYWWRVNAWSEIAAMLTPFFMYAYIKFFTDITFPNSLFFIVGVTTIVWLVVTFLTKPTEENVLKEFYTRIRPGGMWKPIAQLLPNIQTDFHFGKQLLQWCAGVVLVYSSLFGVGKILFGEISFGVALLVIAVVCGGVLWRGMKE